MYPLYPDMSSEQAMERVFHDLFVASAAITENFMTGKSTDELTEADLAALRDYYNLVAAIASNKIERLRLVREAQTMLLGAAATEEEASLDSVVADSSVKDLPLQTVAAVSEGYVQLSIYDVDVTEYVPVIDLTKQAVDPLEDIRAKLDPQEIALLNVFVQNPYMQLRRAAFMPALIEARQLSGRSIKKQSLDNAYREVIVRLSRVLKNNILVQGSRNNPRYTYFPEGINKSDRVLDTSEPPEDLHELNETVSVELRSSRSEPTGEAPPPIDEQPEPPRADKPDEDTSGEREPDKIVALSQWGLSVSFENELPEILIKGKRLDDIANPEDAEEALAIIAALVARDTRGIVLTGDYTKLINQLSPRVINAKRVRELFDKIYTEIMREFDDDILSNFARGKIDQTDPHYAHMNIRDVVRASKQEIVDLLKKLRYSDEQIAFYLNKAATTQF